MSVVQKIYNSDGTVTTTPVNTDMFWLAHDSRWHVRDIEAGTLRRLDNGVKVGTLTKHAYCLADDSSYRLSLPGAPQSAHFTDAGCDPNQPNALRADMGISVGWADDYFDSTYQQYIDITGLPNGKYVLTATANPGDVVKESNYSNDSVTATIQIGDSTATILSTSPGV
jgi:hypothetical protein